MKIKRTIFRDYDIRGIAGVKFEPKIIKEYEKWYGPFPGITINLKTSKAIGKAYGTRIKELGGEKVIVGYEIRPFADKLKAAFIEGIIETGIDVDDAGQTTTPFIYFLTSYLNYDGGVNITGSHNVYFYNGFKMMKKNTSPLYGKELQLLYQMILHDDFATSKSKGKIKKIKDPYKVYKDYILKHINLKRKLNIVIDCGNGTPGLYVIDFFKNLGCNILEGLYLEPNAYFPNHVPDPESPKNMQDLSKKVRETKADIGIAFDADGDRAGFVNEKGEFVYADELLLLLAKDVLSRNKGKKVLFDVKCTQLLVEMVPQFGGVPLMHRTGHAPIKDTLRQDPEVILGGEVSGHFYFVEDYFKIDDGFFAAANVLRLLSEFDGPFSEMFSFIPKRVRTPEIKLPCEDKIKFQVVQEITKKLSQNYRTITIDGARVIFNEQSWGLVRASNTSPYLTLRFEAPTKEKLLKIKNIFADLLEQYPQVKDKLNRREVCSDTGKLGYV